MSDLHGKGATDDIGMLTNSKILEDGNWWIEARLYDENDNIGSYKLEKANDLWNQVNGIDPYAEAKQKGFSIEGYLTDLEKIDATTGGRIINNMELDYMAVVPRPAYKDSIAHSVAKSLGAQTEWAIRKTISNKIEMKLNERKESENLNTEKWALESALGEVVDSIMSSDSLDKYTELNTTLDEFKNAHIKILMKYEDTFSSQDSVDSNVDKGVSKNEWETKILERIKTLKSKL